MSYQLNSYRAWHGRPNTGYRPRANQTSRPSFDASCIWIDGDLVPDEEATAYLLSPALQQGPVVFEDMRCYPTVRGPGIFRLEAHLNRFLRAVEGLGIHDFRWTLSDLRRAVAATVQANSLQACVIRPFFYAGSIGSDQYEPRLAIAAWEWEAVTADSAGQGARMMLTSATRTQPFSPPITGELDADGNVTGCIGANLFVVRDGVIYEPLRASASETIIHHTILTLADDLGYRVVAGRLARDQLYSADEVFVCSTTAEVVPVREIDARMIGDGQTGTITSAIQRVYADTVHGRAARSPGWVEYVLMEPLY